MNPDFDNMTNEDMRKFHKYCNNACRKRLRAEAVNNEKYELGIETET